MISGFIHQNVDELIASMKEQDKQLLQVHRRIKWFKRLCIILLLILFIYDFRIMTEYGLLIGGISFIASIVIMACTYYFIWPKTLLRERINFFLEKK